MPKNKKEDYRIRDARIKEYILNEYDNHRYLEKFYKETALKFDLIEKSIYAYVKILADNGFIEAHIPDFGSPVITGLKSKGEIEKNRLVKNAEKIVKNELEEKAYKRRQHKLNGINIGIGIVGITFTIIDIISNIIYNEGIIKMIEKLF